MILGTAAYMAPEQARGQGRRPARGHLGVRRRALRDADRAAAFAGEDVSDTLAAVLQGQPGLDALPAATPPRLARLLGRCLDRDPRTRLRDIGEARIEDRADRGRRAGERRVGSGSPRPWSAAPAWRRASAVGGSPPCRRSRSLPASLMWAPWRSAPAPTPRKLLASIGADAFAADRPGCVGDPVAGRHDARVRRATGRLDAPVRPQARPVAGRRRSPAPKAPRIRSSRPTASGWRSSRGGKLKKVSVTGGAPVPICAKRRAPRRHLGRRRHDPLHPVGRTQGEADARLGRRWHTGGLRRRPQPGRRQAAVAAGAAGRPGGAVQRALADVDRLGRGQPRRRALVGRGAEGGRPRRLLRPVRAERARLADARRPRGRPIYLRRDGLRGALRSRRASRRWARRCRRSTASPQFRPPAWRSRGGVVRGHARVRARHGRGRRAPDRLDDARRQDGRAACGRTPSGRIRGFSPDGQKLALDISDGKQRDIWVLRVGARHADAIDLRPR